MYGWLPKCPWQRSIGVYAVCFDACQLRRDVPESVVFDDHHCMHGHVPDFHAISDCYFVTDYGVSSTTLYCHPLDSDQSVKSCLRDGLDCQGCSSIDSYHYQPCTSWWHAVPRAGRFYVDERDRMCATSLSDITTATELRVE